MMPDPRLLKDIIAQTGKQAMKEDPAEDLMRLSQDPLLLYAHLQARESIVRISTMDSPDGQLETRLQNLTAASFNHPSAGIIASATARYALKDKLFEPSLRPVAFAASLNDKDVAINDTEADTEDGIPPNLVGGILLACGILFVVLSVADVLAFGWVN